MKHLARTLPVDFAVVNRVYKVQKLSKEDCATSLPFTRGRSFDRDYRQTTSRPSKMNHHSASSTESSISDETETETVRSSSSNSSMESLLEQLESLTIAATKPVERRPRDNSRYYEQYIETRRKAIEFHNTQVRTGTEEDFDDLYAKTAIPKKPAIGQLTEDEEKLVKSVMRRGQQGQVAQYKTAVVEYKDIYKLAPGTWLNDEIINFYMELIADRSRKSEGKLPAVHCYNTFFCSTLRDSGYAKVRRWTKKADVFSKDLLFIPINYAYHWTLGVVDIRNKLIQVYDSLGGDHKYTLEMLLQYLADEIQDKRNESLNKEEWKMSCPKDIPQQKNSYDCGVFTCTFAERLSRRQAFDFSQNDMEIIRKRMVLSIVQQKICI